MTTIRKEVTAYVPTYQKAQWHARAEAYDMSLSEWVTAMTEAGSKKFEVEVAPDESNRRLREQRNDMKEQLDEARARIDRLEEQLHADLYGIVKRFIAANPNGVTFEQVLDHVHDSLPQHINHALLNLEGDAIIVESVGDGGGRFVPVTPDETGFVGGEPPR